MSDIPKKFKIQGLKPHSYGITLEEAIEQGYEYTIVVYEYRDGMHHYEERVVLGMNHDSMRLPTEWEWDGERQVKAHIKGYLTKDQYRLVRALRVIH